MIPQDLEDLLAPIPEAPVGSALRRIRAELAFAWQFAQVFPTHTKSWRNLAAQAAEMIVKHGEGAAAEAEALLDPIARHAKSYTIHCCGHAHIDMDWTWPRYETIAICHDTFSTLDRLMDEYPDLTFAQSQISIYEMMRDHCPEVFEIIRKRVAEGRWCVTAGSWVEADKNMASGESLCRHILCAKRWLKDNLGLDYDAVSIDWMPDTFGHPSTLPSILARGGITRYYRCRPEKGPWLTRWQGPDGATVIAFRDKGWYTKASVETNASPETMSRLFVDYLTENDVKDFLWIHGVGDHGGGPTREALNSIREMQTWPVFPNILHSSVDEYFSTVEAQQDLIAEHKDEINSVFEGCYTSQSRIKKINRLAEGIVPEAEVFSMLANALSGLDYRSDQLNKAWTLTLFNQFHDILAGSSGHAAMEESTARFREIEAITGSIKMRALRRIASKIDTQAIFTADSAAFPSTTGIGDVRVPGGMSTWSAGHPDCEPVVVFNPLPYPRNEMVTVKVWNKHWQGDRIVVRDETGSELPAQVIGSTSGGGHKSQDVLIPARDIPAMGYRTYVLRHGDHPPDSPGVTIPTPGVMENQLIRVEADEKSGAIKRLVSRNSGRDFVPKDALMGVLEMCREAPHGMTAWEIGEFEKKRLLTGGRPLCDDDSRLLREGDLLGMFFSDSNPQQSGPNRACIRTLHTVNNSTVILEIGLSAGSPYVEVNVIAIWQELGSPETGIPSLRLLFPCDVVNPKLLCEAPFGSIERPADGQEVCSQRWIDLSGEECGITLLNDCKYGFGADGNLLRATLLRSTYDPDPYPEIGRHVMRFAIYPHEGKCSASEAARMSAAFNLPMSIVTTELHSGDQTPSKSFVEVLTPNVELAAMKKAEDSNHLILRLYETEGRDTRAQVRISRIIEPGATAHETDILERRLPESTATVNGDMLSVTIPAHGIVTVAIERRSQ